MDPRFIRAEEIGIRLEIVRGLPIWEAPNTWKHQKAVDRIRDSIKPGINTDGCQCVHVADVYIAFPNVSVKPPDISIFHPPSSILASPTLTPNYISHPPPLLVSPEASL